MHPAAEQELDEVAEYYEAIGQDLADAFLDCFRACRIRIAKNPLHYNIRKGLVRRVNLAPQFREYYLPFMIWKDRVVILAVAHAKRRPYYWRHRIGQAKKMF
ncbi:MAG: type II toxin-antitoxin system RelE/ParE family toxin [Prosthecobacter sp.]